MGDVCGFSSLLKPQSSFYRVSSNGMEFEIKGLTRSAICLAREPDPKTIVCRIFIDNNNISFQVNRKVVESVGEGLIEDFLSSDTFKKFWVTWFNGKLKFGQADEITTLGSIELNASDVKFIGFVSMDNQEDLNWKCYLPPMSISRKPILRAIKGGEMRWIKMTKELPKDAIIGGYEHEILYIMRAFHETALTPGKYVPSSGKGFVSWGGWMHEKEDFEILCGFDCVWVTTTRNRIPVGAIEAGYIENTHETMYVGWVLIDGHQIPGKVAPSHYVCYVPYNGHEKSKTTYEILVDPFYQNRSTNNFYVNNM